MRKGTCTVAIVMLSTFTWGELPGEDPRHPPPGDFPTSDIASFHELWWAAQKLEMWCLAMQEQLGWAEVGKLNNIGVFVWSTNSAMNRRVPHGSGSLTMPIDPHVGNGTRYLDAQANVSSTE